MFDVLNPAAFDELEQRTRLAIAARCRGRVEDRHASRREPPRGWKMPPYNTPHFWGAYADGWISDAQVTEAADAAAAAEIERMARVERAKNSRFTKTPAPSRHSKPEPKKTRQYANAIAMEAAHDARLTMGAKALLLELRARCGRGVYTEATKYALARVLNRSVRTIQRYIGDLVKFGYIVAQTRTSRTTGLYTGLKIKLTEKVTPFFAKGVELAKWMTEKGLAVLEAGITPENPEETKLSHKNQFKELYIIPSIPYGRKSSQKPLSALPRNLEWLPF